MLSFFSTTPDIALNNIVPRLEYKNMVILSRLGKEWHTLITSWCKPNQDNSIPFSNETLRIFLKNIDLHLSIISNKLNIKNLAEYQDQFAKLLEDLAAATDNNDAVNTITTFNQSLGLGDHLQIQAINEIKRQAAMSPNGYRILGYILTIALIGLGFSFLSKDKLAILAFALITAPSVLALQLCLEYMGKNRAQALTDEASSETQTMIALMKNQSFTDYLGNLTAKDGPESLYVAKQTFFQALEPKAIGSKDPRPTENKNEQNHYEPPKPRVGKYKTE